MSKPFIYERADTCPNCHGTRCLEGYLENGDPIKLTLAIDMNKDMSKTKVQYLKCKHCRSEFFPNWMHKTVPYPMTPASYQLFINGYITSYKKGEGA